MERIRSSLEIAAHIDQTLKSQKSPHDLVAIQTGVEALMNRWPNDKGLYLQLQKLADFIASTRREISSLRPQDLTENFLPKATDELDAIVEATASATNRIMDAADVITEAAQRMAPVDAEKVNNAVTSIYEACTFQDITGQRVTKVVNVLKVIEERLEGLVVAVSEGTVDTVAAQASEEAATQAGIDAMFADEIAAARPKSKDESLLNGPATPGEEKSQAEIDSIFAGGG